MRPNILCTLILLAVLLTGSLNPKTLIFIYEGQLKSNETDCFLFRIGRLERLWSFLLFEVAPFMFDRLVGTFREHFGEMS